VWDMTHHDSWGWRHLGKNGLRRDLAQDVFSNNLFPGLFCCHHFAVPWPAAQSPGNVSWTARTSWHATSFCWRKSFALTWSPIWSRSCHRHHSQTATQQTVY
jgi:hypothetical protein